MRIGGGLRVLKLYTSAALNCLNGGRIRVFKGRVFESVREYVGQRLLYL